MNPDAEVRLAEQPQWAFEYSIDRVAEVTLDEDSRSECADVVYLAEGRQLGYLNETASDELGW